MRIDSVATTESLFGRGLFGRNSRRLVDAAARTCLGRAKCRPEELDLLINVGIYKEHGLAEPALAALIQEDLGANPGGVALHRSAHEHGTFSFDLMNGGCGTLNALHVLDGFLGSGGARTALIVATDVEPKRDESRGFPYASGGGALLLRAGGADRFVRFHFRTFPEYAALFDARIEWDATTQKNLVVVEEQVAFAHRCRQLGAEVARELLVLEGLTPPNIDLLIASQYPRGFPLDLAAALELSPFAAPAVSSEHVATHTAGPLAALDSAIRSGLFAAARRILFVTVGAGITVGAALYERSQS